mmetsp:Transcript_14235/g.35733  ORF Transcript_14235/g.35733 Transcript_14235/m.35733 type:complete len:206 (-) Transcript_14235:216-833(-)
MLALVAHGASHRPRAHRRPPAHREGDDAPVEDGAAALAGAVPGAQQQGAARGAVLRDNVDILPVGVRLLHGSVVGGVLVPQAAVLLHEDLLPVRQKDVGLLDLVLLRLPVCFQHRAQLLLAGSRVLHRQLRPVVGRVDLEGVGGGGLLARVKGLLEPPERLLVRSSRLVCVCLVFQLLLGGEVLVHERDAVGDLVGCPGLPLFWL